MKFYSQQSEDVILWKKHLNYRNGFFIELGAMDGVTYSNTKFFEDYLGWTGILIEPEKNQFQRLKANRPKCTNLEYAISEVRGEVVFNSRNGGDSGGGIASTHIDTTINEKDNYVVQSLPFRDVFSLVPLPPKVDLFCVDVEGGEWGVISTFPFEQIPVKLVLMETHPNSKELARCREVLANAGMAYDMEIGCNEVWINKGIV
jgi:FkbM family methyltransferase